MATIDWIVWIVLGWILLNVIVKLLINSIERIYKDKIDNAVSKIPSVSKIVFIQTMRVLLIIIYSPFLIVSFGIPLSEQNNPRYRHFIILKKLLLSKESIPRLTFMFRILTRPKFRKEIEELRRKRIMKDTKKNSAI